MSSCLLSLLGGVFDLAATISCGSDAFTDPVTGQIISGEEFFHFCPMHMMRCE
jgi:hypothetical protein